MRASVGTPKGWKQIRLKEVIRECNERVGSNNSLPVLSVTNTRGFYQSQEYFKKQVFSRDIANYKLVRKGEFAYNPSRVNVGSIDLLETYEQGALSPMYVVFSTDKNRLIPKYLKYWTQTERFNSLVKLNTQGSVRDSLNFSSLGSFPFLEPPVKEQRKIAAILGSVDDAIEASRAVIEQLKVVKKGLMEKLLTCGIDKNGKIRDPKKQPHLFKQTKLGPIQKEWEVKPLGELCLAKPEYGANVSAKDYVEGLPRYVRITDIDDAGNLMNDDKKSISKEDAKHYLLSPGDIIFARSGATVGKTYMYLPEDGECAYAGYLIRFRLNQSKLLTRFLFHVTKSSIYNAWVRDMLRAGAQPNINAKEYSSYNVQRPPLEEQKRIIATLDGLSSWIKLETEIEKHFEKVKSGLMQVLLTGEKRVKIT